MHPFKRSQMYPYSGVYSVYTPPPLQSYTLINSSFGTRNVPLKTVTNAPLQTVTNVPLQTVTNAPLQTVTNVPLQTVTNSFFFFLFFFFLFSFFFFFFIFIFFFIFFFFFFSFCFKFQTPHNNPTMSTNQPLKNLTNSFIYI